MVSIIVPVYNTAPYLKDCLDSLIGQTYNDLEIILVDDGSTDNSLSICLDYARKDERIIVLDKENGGQASARNMGLDIAKGAYIAFIDSDDTIAPDLLERNIKYFEEDPALDVVQFPIYRDYGLASARLDIARPGLISGQASLFAEWIEHDRVSWIVCNKLFRKSVFETLRFKEGMVYEDNDMVAEVLHTIQKLYISDQGIYYYHARSNSTTTSRHSLKKEQDTQKVSLNIYQKLQGLPGLKQARIMIQSRLLNVALSIQRNYGLRAADYLPVDFGKNIDIGALRASNLPRKEKIKLFLFRLVGLKAFSKMFTR